jgi:hypothetical protein
MTGRLNPVSIKKREETTNATKSEPVYVQSIMCFQHEKFSFHNMRSVVCWYEPINCKSRFSIYKAVSVTYFMQVH